MRGFVPDKLETLASMSLSVTSSSASTRSSSTYDTGTEAVNFQVSCTGEGHYKRGCNARLLVRPTDLFQTTYTNSGNKRVFATFECPDCKSWTNPSLKDEDCEVSKLPNFEAMVASVLCTVRVLAKGKHRPAARPLYPEEIGCYNKTLAKEIKSLIQMESNPLKYFAQRIETHLLSGNSPLVVDSIFIEALRRDIVKPFSENNEKSETQNAITVAKVGITNFQGRDPKLTKLLEELVLSHQRPMRNTSSPNATIAGLGIDQLQFPASLAREMSCIGKYGTRIKPNKFGNHSVARVGNVYTKCCSDRFPLNPLGEIAASILFNMFPDQELVAPIGLIKISNMQFQQLKEPDTKTPDKHNKAHRSVQDRQFEGLPTEEIFSRYPNLLDNLVLETTRMDCVVQTSIEIEGIVAEELFCASIMMNLLRQKSESHKAVGFDEIVALGESNTQYGMANRYFNAYYRPKRRRSFHRTLSNIEDRPFEKKHQTLMDIVAHSDKNAPLIKNITEKEIIDFLEKYSFFEICFLFAMIEKYSQCFKDTDIYSAMRYVSALVYVKKNSKRLWLEFTTDHRIPPTHR